MSTTQVVEKTITPPLPHPVPTAVHEISLDRIEPSPWNRKRFNEKALDELAASIVNTGGVVQPIVLRPYPVLTLRKSLVSEQHYIDVKGTNTGATAYKDREEALTELQRIQRYQIVAGERRWLASKRAVQKLGFKRDTITATVKEMTDAQALEVTLTENAQREDVPVLELCRTYKALLGQKDSTTGQPYTRELIADRVKKSYSLVCAILNADQAIPEVQKAAGEGKIGDSLVLEIAKYGPQGQEKIFLECFGGAQDDDIRDYDTIKEYSKDKNAEAGVSVRKLREWIAENIHIDLSKAPFKTNDEFLLKGVPSCVKCPKRTGSNPGLFASEVQKGDECTDPGCYEAKKQAFVQIRINEEQQKEQAKAAPAPSAKTATTPASVKAMGPGFSQTSALKAAGPAKEAPAIEIQKINPNHLGWNDKGKPDVLYGGQFELAKPGCKKEKKAIYVSGPQIGKTTHICDVKNCSNHGYSSSYSSGPREPITFARKKEIWEQKVQYVYRDELLRMIATKLPGKIGDQEAAFIAEHIIKTLPHHGHEKVGRIFGLKDSDPESLELHMRKLKGDALMRFIVVCSLVEDLGTGEIAWGGDLENDAPLKMAAKAYRIDDNELLKAAKAQLEGKRPKTAAEKETAQKAKQGETTKPADKAKKPAAKKVKAGKTTKKKK